MSAGLEARARRRGQPIVALALITASWVGARALAWDGAASPALQLLAAHEDARAEEAALSPVPVASDRFTPWPQAAAAANDGSARTASALWLAGGRTVRAAAGMLAHALPVRSDRAPGPTSDGFGWTLLPGDAEQAELGARASARRTASPGGNAAPFPVPSSGPAATRRWSGDAWLLARTGSGPALAGGPAPPTYGASQAGAILRYALAPASRYRPAAYARVSSALSGIDEAEAALGLSARPLPRVPVIALGELRATRSAGRLRLRPAAMLVTQLPRLALPLGLRGEIYAQGGYVAGRGATPFADGQFTFDRALTHVAGHEVRLGGGLWGGAQKGAARLDLGPSARVDLRIGRRIFSRLSLDYRLRVAGKAEPGSGPAISVGAGF